MKLQFISNIKAWLMLCLFACATFSANAQDDFKINATSNCIGVSETKSYTATVPSYFKNLKWSVKGDLEILSVSADTLTVTVKSTNVGKSTLSIQGTLDATGNNCGNPIKYDRPINAPALELYKTFTCSDSIVGTPFVAVGGIYTYSFNPIFYRNLQANIGFDTYRWLIPEGCTATYYSPDSSSVTIRVDEMPTQPLQISVGQCANCLLQKNFMAGAVKPTILSAPNKCVSSTTTQVGFRIEANPLYTYRWETTNPSWAIRKVGTDSVSVTIGNAGAGTVILKTIYYTDTLQESFSIFRPLNSKYTEIVGETCIYPGTEQVYSIYPAPNEAITWITPNGWNADNENPTSSTAIMNITNNAQSGYVIARSKECPMGADTLLVRTQATPPSPITGDSCLTQNVSATYRIAPSLNALGYYWKFPAGWTYNTDMQSTSSITATPTATATSGNIIVYVKGCTEIMDSAIFVTKGFKPSKPTRIDRADGRTCINYMMLDTIVFSTPVQAGCTYAWTAGTGFSIIQNSGNTVRVASNLSAGTKSITVKAISGCGESDPLTKTNAVQGHGSIPITLSASIPVTNGSGDTIGRRIIANKTGNAYKWEHRGIMTNVISNYMPFEYDRGTGVLYAYLYSSTNKCWSRSNPFNTATIIPSGGGNPAPAPMNADVLPMNGPANNTPTVSIYPNPSNGEITVEPKNCEEDKVAVHVHSTSGALVLQKNINTERATTLSLSNLPNGIYLVSVVGKNNTVYSTQRVQLTK